MLAKYLAAETAILEGKEVKFADRTLRMEDLAFVQAGRREWEARVAAETPAAKAAPKFGGLRFSVARFGSDA
ncbi:hypothetical protein EYF70_22555 [Pseudoduganella albidiflava]|nr:hypothetical protein EYF70_22555 [Pseudoduganella albidiflava]